MTKKKRNSGFFATMYSTGFILGISFGLLALIFSFIFGVDLSDFSSSPVWKQETLFVLLGCCATSFIMMCIGSVRPGD